MFYSVIIPSWFIKLNSSLVWKIPTTKKELYLTFDDGPHPTATPFILNCLKEHKAKATFFCLGKNVKDQPAIFRRILDEGHGIGNHTFNHLNGWKTNNQKYVEDVVQASKYIDSTLFRPPYGRISPFVSKVLRTKLNYKIIMWHILSGDFDEKLSPQKCFENVLLNAAKGSIIVFHDSTKAWDRIHYALPKVLKHFIAEGYSFRRLEE